MPGLFEVLPRNPSNNPFRAYVNRETGTALIQPPFNGNSVLEEVSGDVGVRVMHEVTTTFGTTVFCTKDHDNSFSEYPEDWSKHINHTLSRLLDILGAIINQELFVEYYHGEESGNEF